MGWKLAAVGLEEASALPHRFVYEREIGATPERVFAVLADFDRWPLWFGDVRSARWLSPPGERERAGATREVVTDLRVTERFLAWEPGRRFAFYAEEMSIPLARRFVEDFELHPLDGGRTRVVWTVRYELPLPLRLVHPLLRAVFDRMFRKAADGLGRYAERPPA